VRRRPRGLLPLVAAMLGLGGEGLADPPKTACHESPERIGECFTIHGRLFAANGAPTFRILRIGTKRVLGVIGLGEDRERGIPPSVAALVMPDAFKVDVVGDFRVCPFSKEQPGHMQFVCIDDAAHLVPRPH